MTQYPANGSLSITYPAAGTYDDVITAHGSGGSEDLPISVQVQ
jgi:hypothetical protein